MLFIGKDKDIINTNPSEPYFRGVIDFIKHWETKPAYLYIKTSGSTGPPKEIKLSREQLLASVKLSQEKFNLNQSTQFICNLPIDYIAGKLMIIRALELNADLLILKPSTNPMALNSRERYMLDTQMGKNFMAFVPMQIDAMLKDKESVRALNTAKAILIGGTGINQTLRDDIKQLKVPVYLTYGMTETCTHIAVQNLMEEKEEALFETLEGVEISINNNQQLQIRGDVTNNEWITTNDIVELISPSRFHLLGRVDDIINTGGVKINPSTIYKVADKYFKQYFVYGVPDQLLGQKIVIFTTDKINTQKQAEVLSQLKEELAKFARPKEIIVLKEFLLTSSGKINQKETANAYFDHQISDK